MNKHMKNPRMLNGYRVLYEPLHPRAMTNRNWLGYVYEHIKVAEDSLHRDLRADEIVHHLNGDRSDNRASNLLVIPKSQHSKIHSWVNSGAPYVGILRENALNSGKPKSEEPRHCDVCGNTIQSKNNVAYCSHTCSSIARTTANKPSKEELKIDIKCNTWRKLGMKYGVSDNAVRKWAKHYGLIGQS